MVLKNNEDFTIEQIQKKIIELKKEIVLLNTKKITKQKVPLNKIRKTKHKISQMLRLEQLKIHNK